MNVGYAYESGLKRVLRSPSMVFWLYGASLVLALPLAFAMRQILTDAIGGSLVHESLRRGFDMDWYGEFSFKASSGLAATFGPAVVGILPVLGNLQRLLEGRILGADAVVLMAGILFLLAWTFLSGGIIARYANEGESQGRQVFFGDSAAYFFRFLRILIVSLILYAALFRWIWVPLNALVDRATRDVTSETTVMAYSIVVYAIVAAGLVVISVTADYAKIAMVLEHRSSALLAFRRGILFVFGGGAPAVALYLLLLLTGLGLLMLYWIIAPGPGQHLGITVALAFGAGQCLVVGRIILKLWFLASQAALFQSRNAL
jgi:hypothetical protein